jgi:quercetin dioxygenase-like cupin family protein
MSEAAFFSYEDVIRSIGTTPPVELSWGNLVWLIGAADMPEAEQTLGVVTIAAGTRNPLHFHPNCEELLFVLSGEADHKLGASILRIKAGDVIRIPRGVPHWAQAGADAPLVAIISFSAGDRQTETLEETTDIA